MTLSDQIAAINSASEIIAANGASIRDDSRKILSAQRLQEVLSYCGETGEFHWLVSPSPQVRKGSLAGNIKPDGYRQIMIFGKNYRAHRLAWLYVTGEWPASIIDHKNMDRADNRWENLRLATKSTNAANSKLRVDNTSGHKGIHFLDWLGKWVVYVGSRPNNYVGVYFELSDAIRARDEASRKRYGEFARAS